MRLHHRDDPRSRSGYTLIELLVALVLLDCGLLAIVGSGAVIARAARTATRRAEVIALAQSRLEQIAAAPCSGVTSGSRQTADSRERWTVAPDTIGQTREMDVTIEYADGAKWRSIALHSRAPC